MPFTELWCQHVEKMSDYNAFVLPIEDMTRLMNYRIGDASVKAGMNVAYGVQTTEYVQDCAKSESSNRTIPLPPKAISLLEMLAEDAANEWVFVNDDGQRLSYEALRYQTQCLCKAACVPYRGEHVFRHTFATNCYHKGVDVKILSRLLGHADVNITYNIYVHLYGDGFDEMYSALVSEK